MPQNVPKYELMQWVKMVLVRHGVDLSALQFTCTPTTVFLSGRLLKDPRGEFSVNALETMLRELEGPPYVLRVNAELDNWVVESRFGEWTLTPLKRQRREG